MATGLVLGIIAAAGSGVQAHQANIAGKDSESAQGDIETAQKKAMTEEELLAKQALLSEQDSLETGSVTSKDQSDRLKRTQEKARAFEGSELGGKKQTLGG